MEDHRSNLSKICRICFKLLDKKEFFYLKIPRDYFQSFLYLHKTDNENIHPTQICQKRYLHATMAIKRNTTPNANPFNNWNAHFDKVAKFATLLSYCVKV